MKELCVCFAWLGEYRLKCLFIEFCVFFSIFFNTINNKIINNLIDQFNIFNMNFPLKNTYKNKYEIFGVDNITIFCIATIIIICGDPGKT